MKAVVLLSGGIDSAVALAMAVKEGRECEALTFDYGQLNRTELECAVVQAVRQRVPITRVRIEMGFTAGTMSRNVDMGRPIEEIGAKGDKPKAYVPARNTVFLAHALALVEYIDAREIWIGANKDDHAGFPDCRERFFKAFLFAAAQGTNIQDLEIRYPLLQMRKRDVVRVGRELGVDLYSTSSCYLGENCGSCDACVLRADAVGAP